MLYRLSWLLLLINGAFATDESIPQSLAELVDQYFVVGQTLPSDVVYLWKGESVFAYQDGSAVELDDVYLPAKSRKWQSGDLLLIGDGFTTSVQLVGPDIVPRIIDCQVPLEMILNAQWYDGALFIAGFIENDIYVAIVDDQGLVTQSARHPSPNKEHGESVHLIFSAIVGNQWVLWTPRSYELITLSLDLELRARVKTALPSHILDYQDSTGYEFHMARRSGDQEKLKTLCTSLKGKPIRNHATGFAYTKDGLILSYYQSILFGCVRDDGVIESQYQSAIATVSLETGKVLHYREYPKHWATGFLRDGRIMASRTYEKPKRRWYYLLLPRETP